MKKDLTNQRFGKLVVLKDSGKRYNGRVVWECQCDCGNIHYVTTDRLTSGKTKSCGCIRKKDLTNKRFGKLITICPTNKHSTSGCIIWKCKCDCGNFYYVSTEELTRGNIKSCGCYQYEWNKKNLTGKRFGKLTVLKDSNQRQNNKILWKCKCDCGTITNVATGDLISGHIKSCGCTKSYGEEIISQILTENNISFEKQWSGFLKQKCMNKDGTYPLKFDFYLPDYNCAIEYDGKQHFEPIDYFGGKNGFIKTQERDNIKNQYCKNNNIKLIRIPYTDLKKLDFTYLKQALEQLADNAYQVASRYKY